jgi:integrase/recombinase XerC
MQAEVSRVDISELIRAHVRDQRREGLAESSIANRRRLVGHLAAGLDPVAVFDAEPEAIQQFLDGRAIGPRARYTYLSNLHSFYGWAIRAGHTSVDPTLDIRRPRFQTGKPRPIHGDDLKMALALSDPVTGLILAAAAYAGLRCCEIARLAGTDIRSDLPEPLLFAYGKGGKERTIPLHPGLLDALQRHGIPRTGQILRRADGRPLPAWEVSQRVNRYLHGLGIAATAHQLRHWFGTQTYATSNHDLIMVAGLMGHASVTTTQIYADYDRAGAYAAVAALAV